MHGGDEASELTDVTCLEVKHGFTLQAGDSQGTSGLQRVNARLGMLKNE